MKINKLFACLLFVGFNVAFADTVNFDTIFAVDAGDVSISFLAAMFGNVSTVLVGGSNQVVSQMFMVFNAGIIAFVTALVFYTLTMSVINTAQDGNAMGQKVSTWIVLRIVAGMSALIPQYNGYSLIQVLVMWSVVQGVGFADSIWSQALDTMKDYGGAMAVPSQTQDAVYGDIATIATGGTTKNAVPVDLTGDTTASEIFAAAVCARAKYNQKLEDSNSSGGTAPSIADYGYFRTSVYADANTDDDTSATDEIWCFGGPKNSVSGTCDASCGEFKVTYGTGSFYAQALGDMILVTAPAAVSQYDSFVSACEADSDKCKLGNNNGDSDFTTGCGQIDSNGNPEYSQSSVCIAANILNSGASTYYSTSLADRISNDSDQDDSWITSAKNTGWAMAGSHYVNISGGGSTTTQYSYSELVPPTTITAVPDNTAAGGTWATSYSNSAWYKVYKNMLQPSPSCTASGDACAALAQYMVSTNAWANYMIGQAMNLNTDSMGCDTQITGRSGLFGVPVVTSSCTGTGSSNSIALTYDKFTAYMLQSLISGYRASGGTGSYTNNPFGHLGTGKSLMFPETSEGDFTTFPLYLWSLLTQNIAVLSGIDLYRNDKTGKIFAKDMSAIPSLNTGCLKVASLCSSSNSDSTYQGCLDAAIQYNCVSTSNIGLLGGVRALSKEQLVDPLYSMAIVGQTFIKYSTAYWGATIKEVYRKTTKLAGAYTGVGIATATGMSALSWAAVMAAGGWDVSGAFAILTGAAISTYQLLFQIDKVVMEAYLPLGSAVALVFFLLGIVLGVYLPFIPFLLFLFGVINWLISVIEAMVAAPLVAMGITHPEGHDLLGKAEQSIMLLLGVFIRPTAMVIGFVIAVTLTYLMMQFLNYGFVYTANPLLASAAVNSSDSFNMIAIVGILLVYAYVAIEVINQCFGMIFQVPDKILRWIGGPQEQSNVGQMMQSVKGGVQSGAQGAGSAASGQASRGAQVSAGSSQFQKSGERQETNQGASEGGNTTG